MNKTMGETPESYNLCILRKMGKYSLLFLSKSAIVNPNKHETKQEDFLCGRKMIFTSINPV